MALNKEILNDQIQRDFDNAFKKFLNTLLNGKGNVSIYTLYKTLSIDLAKSVSNRVDAFVKSGDVKTIVNTGVNTVVATTGGPFAQAGKGTGAGVGKGEGKVT